MESPQFIKALNSWKTNEYNIDIASYVPKFFVPSKNLYSNSSTELSTDKATSLECKIIPGDLINFDSDSKQNDKFAPKYPSNCLEQIDSSSWLKKHGLAANKLTLQQILTNIGFKHTEEYLKYLNRSVSSRYSKGLYLQTLSKNGAIYNITCNQNKLVEYSERLKDVINSYRKRLQWLNSESRRIFGLISERNVTIVIDCKQTDPKMFDQFRNCMIKLLREQISKLGKFNLIRCSHEVERFKEKNIQVSSDTIDEAIDWLNNWSHCYATLASATSTSEACLLAFQDPMVEAVYLISEGLSSNASREILYDKLTKQSTSSKIKLNIVSYNCDDPSTIEFLRRLALGSYNSSRFHAYCLLRQVEHYTAGSIDANPTKSLVVANKRMFGGAPPGSGINTELMLMFEEMQTANDNLEHVNSLLEAMSARNTKKSSTSLIDITPQEVKKGPPAKVDEEYLGSEEWLNIYGLAAKKLQLFDVLSHVAFRHCDGVVDVKQAPSTGIGEAISREKLINAKYCDQFAHVIWNDGTIRHVHVTPEIHRNYEKNIRVALEQYDKRIKWLGKGSRELFGTVIENNIYILIDTSQSMQLSLDFVKQKLIALMQEQLKSKQRFNLIAFNSKMSSWRDRMVEVDEYSLNDAWKWIKSLSAQGTTNTLAAIRFALSDIRTEAIYLLTDGRPDQAPRQILSQVQLAKKVPIHVISFNCNDPEANHFLHQLANETGGRYHYFNENYWSADPNGPLPFESRDVILLKEEISKGIKYLNQVEALRNECTKLSWLSKKETIIGKCSKDHSEKEQSTKNPEELQIIEEYNKLQRNSRSSFDLRYQNIKSSLFATNKQSMLNSINNPYVSDWMLPETKDLLERQSKRQQRIRKSEQSSAEIKKSKSETRIHIKRIHEKPPVSLIKWLKQNSLSALKLTILDILGPIVVKQNAKYVELLNSYVTSKVWNDIFPLTNILNSGKNELKLLNPKTVDLVNYEKKLKEQINIYKKHLTEVVWNSLPSSEKEKFNSNIPVEFLEENNEYRLLKSLENYNWPVTEDEINAIKKEIDLAYRYIQQSKDLREFILTKEEIVNKETKLQSEKDIMSALKQKSSSEKRVQKSNESLEGKTVLARHDLHGYYYEALVYKQNDPRHLSVKFRNGVEQQNMPTLFILRLNETSSRSHLEQGDYVMALVVNEFSEKCYVPGIIQFIDTIAQPKLFTVMYFNGTEGFNIRNELISISKNRYALSTNYIRNKLGLEQKFTVLRQESKKPELPDHAEPKVRVDNFKKEIIDSIQEHFSTLRLDEKYHQMYEELLQSKEKQKSERSDLKKEIKSLKKQIKTLISERSTNLYRGDDTNYRKLLEESKQHEADKNEQNRDDTHKVQQHNKQLEHEEERNKKREAKDEEDFQKNHKHREASEKVLEANTHKEIKKSKGFSLTEELEHMRKTLPELNLGEEVLAKWPDDGWYYKSLVKQNVGGFKYKIEDMNKVTIEISREDVISESDASNFLELFDPVVALHPNYSFSYAPGIIIKIANDFCILVRFYDGSEVIVNKEEVYKIPLFKFEYDVEIIIGLEKKWVGQTVIARNPFSYVYELGKVKDRIGNGRQYVIEWSGDRITVQNASHIFGRFTHNPPIEVNDYVLASKKDIYLPGRVIGTKGETFRVKFVDGVTDDEIKAEDCFWLSRDYYEDACNFFKRQSQIQD